MTQPKPRIKNRRQVFQDIAGIGAVAGMLPLLGRFLNDQPAMSLFPSAFAQGINTGVRPGQGSVSFISGAQTAPVAMAEWEPPKNGDAEIGGLRIAQGDAAVGKAPTDASRYSAQAFEFPSGTFRVLTWKKGGPVMHQITYETEIMVLQGSVTLTPPHGIAGPTATLRRGDALYLPSGVLRNMKPSEDVVLLQAFVGSTKDNPKRAILFGKDVKEGHTPTHIRYKHYEFEGNGLRVGKFAKGYKTNPAAPAHGDELIYVTKGHMRRIEGDKTYDVVAGDAVRETPGIKGYWEFLEESEIIATDGPVRPGAFSPGMVSTGGGMKFFAMVNDENGRSRVGFADIAMKKVSDTEFLSEKQPGLVWRVGFRTAITPYARTSKSYTSGTGPYEQHTGGTPHFTGCMAGHIETTMQDGGVLRRAAGEFCYITPGAQHHSSFRSDVPAVYFNLSVPGTDEDTKLPVFK